jgi:hypothetical protein
MRASNRAAGTEGWRGGGVKGWGGVRVGGWGRGGVGGIIKIRQNNSLVTQADVFMW